jgi:DNA polymerase-4
VLAASYEAKAFGVRGGMPGRRARELCPQLTFVSGHFKDYKRLGDAAIKVLGDFTPLASLGLCQLPNREHANLGPTVPW